MKKILLIALLVALCGCKKSFLTLAPTSQASSANFYKNTSDIGNAVTACYANLQTTSMYADNFITMMEARADNVEDDNPGGNAGRDYNIDRFIAGSDNAAVNNAYNCIYNDIFNCNQVIANIDVVTDANLKNQYKGEALFLRALAYFNAVRFWGGVPVVLSPISTAASLTVGRSSTSAVYSSIESDLTTAASLLPATYSKTNAGRATSGAAIALLGKVYLTEQKWGQAATTLKTLLPTTTNPYGYTLLPNVADVFNVASKLNAEIIFAVHYDKTIVGQGHAQFYYFNKPIIDPNLLNAYSSTDTRRDLLNTQVVDANDSPIKKYYDTFDPTNKTLGYDVIVLRYADVMLMYAEALNEMAYSNDPTSDNFVYLNMVRTRAKAASFTPAQLPDQATFRTAILQERRLEFPFELQRWFDLIRTNTAIQAMANVGLVKLTIQQYQFIYPIPIAQIQLINNPTLFPQNPGYN